MLRGSYRCYSEWTCKGSPKLQSRVGAYGIYPVRYQRDVYDCIQAKWTFIVKLGGTAEVMAFVPFMG